MQQAEAFRLQRQAREAHAGHIAVRPAETGNEPGADWISAADEHDRYSRGRIPRRPDGRVLDDHDRNSPLHQIGGQRREPVRLVICPAELDRHVVAFDEAGVGKAIAQCRDAENRIRSRCRIEKADDRHPLRAH